MTSTSNTLKHAPDLNTHAPRSARVRLGNFAILPRLLDKCRADIIGKIGEYQTNCTIDKEFLTFTAISYDQLRAELQKGKGDGEILKWIHENSKNQRTPWEINQWSEYQGIRSPEHHKKDAALRHSWN